LACFETDKSGTGWKHLHPKFNFEVDKNLRVPFDFSTVHKNLEKNNDNSSSSSSSTDADPGMIEKMN